MKEKYPNKELLELDLILNYESCIQNLKSSNVDDFIKIFSIINLDKILSNDDAKTLINCLTNHSTPLREACANKLEELLKDYSCFFLDDFSKDKFLNAIIDINPNVSRCICNIIKNTNELKKILEDEIIINIEKIIIEIKKYEKEFSDYFDNKIKNTKNHAKNKKLFALYWNLEALSLCISKKNYSKVLKILKYTINFIDFTIREKTVEVALAIGDEANEILQKAKLDQNFYVKNLVYDKINSEV